MVREILRSPRLPQDDIGLARSAIERGQQFSHVLADFPKNLIARFLRGSRDSTDDRRADDQPISHWREQFYVFWRANAEPDADRQIGLRAKPADVIDEFGWQLGTLASNAGDRHIVEKTRRCFGNSNRPLARRRWRY